MEDEELLERYASAIGWREWEGESEPPPGLTVKTSESGETIWHLTQVTADASALQPLYAALNLPGQGDTRLPPLYEKLICTYRWAEVDLGDYRLLANLPDSDLSALAATLREDKGLWETLFPNGYIPFGKGPDLDYDPVCFDFCNRQRNGDCRIVKLSHEAILCRYRIVEVSELAPNFRTLVLDTLRKAPETTASL